MSPEDHSSKNMLHKKDAQPLETILERQQGELEEIKRWAEQDGIKLEDATGDLALITGRLVPATIQEIGDNGWVTMDINGYRARRHFLPMPNSLERARKAFEEDEKMYVDVDGLKTERDGLVVSLFCWQKDLEEHLKRQEQIPDEEKKFNRTLKDLYIGGKRAGFLSQIRAEKGVLEDPVDVLVHYKEGGVSFSKIGSDWSIFFERDMVSFKAILDAESQTVTAEVKLPAGLIFRQTGTLEISFRDVRLEINDDAELVIQEVTVYPYGREYKQIGQRNSVRPALIPPEKWSIEEVINPPSAEEVLRQESNRMEKLKSKALSREQIEALRSSSGAVSFNLKPIIEEEARFLIRERLLEGLIKRIRDKRDALAILNSPSKIAQLIEEVSKVEEGEPWELAEMRDSFDENFQLGCDSSSFPLSFIRVDSCFLVVGSEGFILLEPSEYDYEVLSENIMRSIDREWNVTPKEKVKPEEVFSGLELDGELPAYAGGKANASYMERSLATDRDRKKYAIGRPAWFGTVIEAEREWGLSPKRLKVAITPKYSRFSIEGQWGPYELEPEKAEEIFGEKIALYHGEEEYGELTHLIFIKEGYVLIFATIS